MGQALFAPRSDDAALRWAMIVFALHEVYEWGWVLSYPGWVGVRKGGRRGQANLLELAAVGRVVP